MILNIFSNKYLYKNLNDDVIFTLLEIIRNENKFIKTPNVKLHCIYLVVLLCQYITQHGTTSSPKSICNLLKENSSSFMTRYQKNLIHDIIEQKSMTQNAEIDIIKKCNRKGLDILLSMIPGIIDNLVFTKPIH